MTHIRKYEVQVGSVFTIVTLAKLGVLFSIRLCNQTFCCLINHLCRTFSRKIYGIAWYYYINKVCIRIIMVSLQKVLSSYFCFAVFLLACLLPLILIFAELAQFRPYTKTIHIIDPHEKIETTYIETVVADCKYLTELNFPNI